ncbi:Hypothetical predicted protein [Olea europaea subsp. europaea]|nr:Hypothetical predicted protein [Olea europaea subsp. europaea]
MLCLEYFSRMVKVATNDSEFNYHPKCDPLKMTHLTFTDDLILFARGDVMSVQILMDCLSNFDFASGLRMNILKPSLYTVGVYGKELDDIIELTNFLKGTMSFRYLGIPLASKKLKVSVMLRSLIKLQFILVLGITHLYLMSVRWNLLGRCFKLLNVFCFLFSLFQRLSFQELLLFVRNFFGAPKNLW